MGRERKEVRERESEKRISQREGQVIKVDKCEENLVYDYCMAIREGRRGGN